MLGIAQSRIRDGRAQAMQNFEFAESCAPRCERKALIV
jgi:hypothetical protein